MNNKKEFLAAAAGFLLLGAAGIGIFLPVWPTTPFVLLHMGCFGSIPKIQARIMSAPYFREHYSNYETRRDLPVRALAFSLLFLWAALAVSMFFAGALW